MNLSGMTSNYSSKCWKKPFLWYNSIANAKCIANKLGIYAWKE